MSPLANGTTGSSAQAASAVSSITGSAAPPAVSSQSIDLSQTPQLPHRPTSLPPPDLHRLASPHTPLTPVSPPLSSASSNPAHRLEQLRTDSTGRISSPFQLSSPRFWTTPPSPRTVEVFSDQPTVPTPPAVPTPEGEYPH